MHYNPALGGAESSESRPALPRRTSVPGPPPQAAVTPAPADTVVRAASAIAMWARGGGQDAAPGGDPAAR